MASEILRTTHLDHLLQATAHLLQLSRSKMWLDYDQLADVLYLHFEEPPASTHSEMREDGIIVDYRGNQIVGLTILEASTR